MLLIWKKSIILKKKEGYTTICKASDNELVRSLYEAGVLPGALWKQGLLTGCKMIIVFYWKRNQ